ncbi:MAG TPA: DUF885 domain-containing protein, partial [Woeseiaceae bacterium]|nr:DUF885 domain-containing protein [Woeseiaceae bacterium]
DATPSSGHPRASSAGWIIMALLCCGLLAACGEPQDPAAPRAEGLDEQPAAANPAQEATTRLDALIERFVESRRSESERTELRPVSAEAFLDEIASDRELLDQFRAVDAARLPLEAAIDRKAVIGILESEIHTAEQRRLWENDASLYVPARQIGRLLEQQAVEPAAERAVSLQGLLAQIPERLEHAKRNLKNPPQRFTEGAVFKTEGTLASLREGAATLADQPTVNREDYMQTANAAIEALAAYLAFLQTDLLPRSTGSWAIGKEQYDYILRHRWHLDDDADAILARGRAAFEETEALAQEVAERIEPGKHWSEVYERLKDEHPPADGIKQAYQEAIDAAQAFVREHGIVTLPEGERVVTVDTPPAMRRSSPFGTFQSVDPFGDGLEGQLVLTPIEDWMTPEQQAQRLRSHHDAWIPIIAVHEAYPGHHVDALKTRENPRLLRKVVREPIFSEGWGLFTEELMYEEGFLTGDDVRLTQLRNRLWRAARVILDVSLHTGQMTFEEAVDFLAERVRFERYAAELEVGMYTERPTYVLGYLIGMQEIMDIREEWIERFGEPSPPSEFYDQLLTVGALPPVLVRESLFGGAAPGAQPLVDDKEQ